MVGFFIIKVCFSFRRFVNTPLPNNERVSYCEWRYLWQTKCCRALRSSYTFYLVFRFHLPCYLCITFFSAFKKDLFLSQMYHRCNYRQVMAVHQKRFLQDLSQYIGEFWKSLGRKLKVPNSKIDEIQCGQCAISWSDGKIISDVNGLVESGRIGNIW